LGEAVLGINPKLGRLVTKEEAIDHAKRCRDAGLVHMIDRNKLDTVWLGVKPGKKLLTICNCSPCCCLWGMIPQLTPTIGDKVKKMDGVNVKVTDLYAGCGTCAQEICFVDAIHLMDGRAEINSACRGCGQCVEVCTNDAIELTLEDFSFIESTIEQISNLVELD